MFHLVSQKKTDLVQYVNLELTWGKKRSQKSMLAVTVNSKMSQQSHFTVTCQKNIPKTEKSSLNLSYMNKKLTSLLYSSTNHIFTVFYTDKKRARGRKEKTMRPHPPAARNFLQTTSKTSTPPLKHTHSGSNNATHSAIVHCQCEVQLLSLVEDCASRCKNSIPDLQLPWERMGTHHH